MTFKKKILLWVLIIFFTSIYVGVLILTEYKILQYTMTGLLFGWFIYDLERIIKEW